MLLIREIMFCKPGKVKTMVENSIAMAKLSEEGAGVVGDPQVGEGKLDCQIDI